MNKLENAELIKKQGGDCREIKCRDCFMEHDTCKGLMQEAQAYIDKHTVKPKVRPVFYIFVRYDYPNKANKWGLEKYCSSKNEMLSRVEVLRPMYDDDDIRVIKGNRVIFKK